MRSRKGRETGGRSKGKLDLRLLAASFGVAVGVVLVVLGFRSSVTGREQQLLPDAIESIDPISAATQVPRQTRVFVDFLPGYEAEMTVDGVLLPTIDLGELSVQPPGLGADDGEQVAVPPGALYEQGNWTLTFVPAPGGPIEQFDVGLHTASVTFWKIDEGRTKAQLFSWTFYVI